jgi:type I restriction-modification system DNA methylase subunit
MLTSTHREFIKAFDRADHTKHRWQLFQDFVTLSFCALAKPPCVALGQREKADKLEAEYMRVVGTYRERLDVIRQTMPRLLALTAAGVNEHRCDFLGEVYHELELHNKEIGQFFTPFDMSYVCAAMTVHDLREKMRDTGKRFMTVQEPAAGAGGMLLALAAVLQDKKIDPQKCLWFEAVDLSDVAFKMCYIQTALRGLPGRVSHGNTLSMEIFGSYITAAGIDFLHRHGNPFAEQEGGKKRLGPTLVAENNELPPYKDLLNF